ncbi:unnamed protein product [Mesocestoides corti]|uniref:DNA topoisomerase (ATP-hydrolyzing) n=1 Tax=Mesocestoides corti TaxID=53468 RepID=A0A0R3UGE1_MESCO|nr:unnamed protein product [Mesocestoides corti]
MDVISRIEIFVLELLAELMNRGGLKHTSEKYVVLKKMRFPFAQVKNYSMRFIIDKSHFLAQISLFLSIVYKALKSGTYVTKRAIFYENPRVFLNQCAIDRLISRLCKHLELSRLEMNTVSCFLLTLFRLQRLNQSYLAMQDLTCNARFVLVIEKDATLQKVMASKFYKEFQPCLLITSKGYPDLSTRLFLSKLNQKYPTLPIFALVDADPHGRLGWSFYKSYYKLEKGLQDEVCSMPFIKLNYIQISLMEVMKKKAEIQCLENLGLDFLCSEYLPRKLQQEGIISNRCSKLKSSTAFFRT